MGDEIDFTLKKKKKKKPTDLEDHQGGEGEDVKPEPPAEEKPAPKPEKSEEPPASGDIEGELNFDKKKKKKKKVLEMLEPEDAAPPAAAAKEEVNTDQQAPAPASAKEADDTLDVDLTKKKKKKKKAVEDIAQENEAPEETSAPAPDAEMEHTYDELLERVFRIMREKNPDMVDSKKQLVLKPPQVHRLGTRRTAFANFVEYCKLLHRTPDHVQNFLVAELGASGSVDASGSLVIRGRFQQKQIENVLRRYIREYVACHTCKSRETTMTKENRLFFLKCETCGSRCSVASIRQGYQAVTGKRAAIRAKTDG